ncbi:MAG: helix-turn-helix transcriptional regulator [Ktedonobacteraceae bacterium]
MNKTDRMLAIVLELQGKGRQRAEDLADTFETSKRTIYRDIQALCEAGVPLISTPGHGYTLMQGYFLPPLSFTTEEATMLLLGSDYMAQNFDAQYRQAAQSASRKIEGVLPERLRGDVQYLQQSIHFVAPETPGSMVERESLQKLRRAILERVSVRFHYHTRYVQSDQSSRNTREADPYGLVYFANAWHLVAYCHLRQDRRNFRLERMEDLELLSQTFQRPADLQMHRPDPETARNIVVRALFDQEVARWVREARPYSTISVEDTTDGLLLTCMLRQESEIRQWLLSWGSHVRVLEPASLRQWLLLEAEMMLRNHRQ